MDTPRNEIPPATTRPSSPLQELIKSAPWQEKGAAVVLILVACFSIFFLGLTLSSPVLDQHAFRQSQTAINIYYAVHEGSVLAYQTPVLGTPWSVPYEVPVYQTIVAAIVTTTGLAIDPAGRLVSYLFLLGTVGFGGLTLRLILPRDRLVLLVFATLMLASPLYLFWGRTVLIETCAIFLGTAWLYMTVLATRQNNLMLAALSAPLCILAGLAKATSWPAFVVAIGLFWFFEWRMGKKMPLAVVLVGSAGIALALVISFLWIGHSDEVKSAGPLARHLVSTTPGMLDWNYGPLSQRFSQRFWLEDLPARMLPDVLGLGWLLVLIGLTHLTIRDRYFVAAIAAVLLFFVPLALFTNLHLVHNYYQSANGLFLIAAAAIMLAALVKKGRVRLAAGIFLAIVISQFVRFADIFWPLAANSTRSHPHYEAARFIRDNASPGKALVALGVGWSPIFHYYSERKGLALPNWVGSADALKAYLTDRNLMGGLEIGSVVACSPLGFDERPDVKAVAKDFIIEAEQRALQEKRFGNCVAIVLK